MSNQQRYDYGESPCSSCASGWWPGECLDDQCTATYDYSGCDLISPFVEPYSPPSPPSPSNEKKTQ